ncbi:dihydroorotate dehydrogenase [candidate division KSB1 bacterium]
MASDRTELKRSDRGAGPDLRVNIGALSLANPVMVASGTFGYGEEFADVCDIDRIGAIVTKAITLKPKSGNPGPRVWETPSGMLNSIGLENVGLERFLSDKLPFLQEHESRVIVNIAAVRIDDYARLAERLSEAEGVDALEVNISCPNVKAGGLSFGTDPDQARAVTLAVRAATNLPLLIKLTPNVTDIGVVAEAVVDGGADSISLINTLVGMAIDLEREKPALGNIFGGLSGPAIKPVALACLWKVRGRVDVPLIGMGGIVNGRDAAEFLMAGATAVQVGTASFVEPRSAEIVLNGLIDYLKERNLDSARDLVGRIHI